MDDNINNETMFSVDESEKIKETGGNTEHNIKEELEKTSNKESEKKKPNLSYIQVPSDKDKSTFVHTADLHLAPRSSTIAKRDSETGRLLRDLDMDKAFIQAVNETIESQSKPSAFIIAGDIYDTWKGSADAFITSVLQIKRLVKSGIAVIGIAGNHDTPPNTIKTPMFQMLADVFSDNEMVCLAYNEIKHVVVGDVEYVLLPHYVCIRGDFDRSDLAAQSNAKYRVLLVHGVAAGDPSLKQMDEVKEIPIAKWILDMDWSYVAFGHFHKPGWIPGYKGKAAYSGSLENTVISGPDVCHHRGPVFVDLEKNGTEIYDMHEKPIRRIMSLPEIDITGQDISADELDKRITNLITTSDIENAIVIHKVKGITKSLYKTIPHRTFNHVSQAALYLRTDFEFASDAFVLDAVKPEDTDEETDNIDGTEETSVQENETQEVDPTQTFLPLDKEMELAVKQLVKTGRISANKEEKIKNVLLGLITSE